MYRRPADAGTGSQARRIPAKISHAYVELVDQRRPRNSKTDLSTPKYFGFRLFRTRSVVSEHHICNSKENEQTGDPGVGPQENVMNPKFIEQMTICLNLECQGKNHYRY
jgi:hypothetical protein